MSYTYYFDQNTDKLSIKNMTYNMRDEMIYLKDMIQTYINDQNYDIQIPVLKAKMNLLNCRCISDYNVAYNCHQICIETLLNNAVPLYNDYYIPELLYILNGLVKMLTTYITVIEM